MHDDDVAAAWESVVPVENETWWLSEAEVRSVLRSRTDLSVLVDLGVSVDGPRVSGSDTWNIGFYDPSRSSRPALELALLGRLTRDSSQWTAPRSPVVSVTARPPGGDGCEGGRWDDVPVRGGVLTLASVADGRAVWTGQVEARGSSGHVRAPVVADLWEDALGRFRFHSMPDSGARELAATWRRGTRDCLALSTYLVEELRTCGVKADVRVGYLHGGFGTDRHHWVPFVDEDGRCKVLDLSMALVTDRYLGAEHRDFCRGSLLNRVGERVGDGGAVVAHSCALGEVQVPLDRKGSAR